MRYELHRVKGTWTLWEAYPVEPHDRPRRTVWLWARSRSQAQQLTQKVFPAARFEDISGDPGANKVVNPSYHRFTAGTIP